MTIEENGLSSSASRLVLTVGVPKIFCAEQAHNNILMSTFNALLCMALKSSAGDQGIPAVLIVVKSNRTAIVKAKDFVRDGLFL